MESWFSRKRRPCNYGESLLVQSCFGNTRNGHLKIIIATLHIYLLSGRKFKIRNINLIPNFVYVY